MKIKFWEQKTRRLTLRGWAAMEDLQKRIKDSSQEGNWSEISDLVFQTIELCQKLDRDSFWVDAVETYNKVLQLNQPTKNIPILTSKEKSKPMPWEYQGRAWYFWLNLFAKAYGWDAEKVGALDIDDAVALYQEIVIDEQLEKEWNWGLSEISYEYNKTTKKSVFRPLPRPDWMKRVIGKPQPVRERKIHSSAVPAGIIINLDETAPDKIQ